MCYLPYYLLSLLLIILDKPPITIAVGEKSRQKCREYADAVYSNQYSPVLSRRTSQNKVSECGIVEVPLIIGGVRAQVKEFPHMATIGYQSPSHGPTKWLCGGTLISEYFVLTAAHCLDSRDNGPARVVLLGALSVKQHDRDTQEIPVAERIPHPRYRPPSKYNDIGLIRLRRQVSFTPYVRPACLNTHRNIGDRKAIATGFGKQSYDAQSGSIYLMKVQLDLISSDQCRTAYKPSQPTMAHGYDESMLCAGSLMGGKDTCQGDSGGPLQTVLDNPYCMYNIIGVTSFGKFCGFPNSPSIYTRVTHYLSWIENIVWP